MVESVVIVGASLAGIRAAEMLRRKGYEGRLTLIGDEEHRPYDRPPLSKQLLTGAWEEDKIQLRRKPYEDLNLDLRLGQPARSLSTERKEVTLQDGSVISYDALIVATGARARALPNQPELDGLFLLRTLGDSRRLALALADKPRVCVIGAGFIGAEVASSARELGCEVVVLEALEAPLMRGLGRELGDVVGASMREHGVDLRCGVTVQEFVAQSPNDTSNDTAEGRAAAPKLAGVRLAGGERIDCEVCVVGIGAQPNIEWLEGSGLELRNGVVVDAHCRAADHVYAIGDVANFFNPLFEESMRLEHWSNAVEGARAAVEHLLQGDAAGPYHHVPSFWSDQFGVKIQGAGRPRGEDTMEVVAGSLEERKFCAIFGRDHKLTGVLTFSMPPQAIRYQKLIGAGATWQEALAGAAAGKS